MTDEKLAAAISSEFAKLEICPIYDYWLPPEENPGTYVNLGNVSQGTTPTKGMGTIEELTIYYHVWTDRLDRRADVISIMDRLTKIARSLVVDGMSTVLTHTERHVMTDTSTTTPFLHGVVLFEFTH